MFTFCHCFCKNRFIAMFILSKFSSEVSDSFSIKFLFSNNSLMFCNPFEIFYKPFIPFIFESSCHILPRQRKIIFQTFCIRFKMQCISNLGIFTEGIALLYPIQTCLPPEDGICLMQILLLPQVTIVQNGLLDTCFVS